MKSIVDYLLLLDPHTSELLIAIRGNEIKIDLHVMQKAPPPAPIHGVERIIRRPALCGEALEVELTVQRMVEEILIAIQEAQ